MNEIGPLLAIRADASNRSGTGHVMRTLAVAQEWLDRGGRVSYLCAVVPLLLKQRLLAEGCSVVEIESSCDADSTIAQAERLKPNILLVDHYDLPAGWWAALPKVRKWKTAALNDFSEPLHPEAEIRIFPTVKEVAGEHSGAEHLLIRKELRRSEIPPPPPEEARNVLLALGGADPLNAGPFIAAQVLNRFPSLQVRAIVGPAAMNLPDFEALAQVQERLEIVRDPESMAPHLRWADTAIVSPSTTAFEVLHHGVVTGFILTANNQEEVAATLTASENALMLADFRDAPPALELIALQELLLDKNRRRDLASRGAALVDGLGAKRACDLLGLPQIQFRAVGSGDLRVLWEWANDPATRAASFSSKEISWEEHVAWFEGRVNSSDPGWIAESSSGQKIAFLRFDQKQGGTFTMSLNLAPEFRGMGIGALLIGKACQAFENANGRATIYAWIKNENIASQRSFEKAGFTKTENAEFSDRLLYSRSL